MSEQRNPGVVSLVHPLAETERWLKKLTSFESAEMLARIQSDTDELRRRLAEANAKEVQA